MGYKYRNGEVPQHVDSSQSNPTNPHLGVFPDSSDVVKAKKDSNYNLLRMSDHEWDDNEIADYKKKVDDASKSEDINNANTVKRGMVQNLLSKTKAQADNTSVKRK